MNSEMIKLKDQIEPVSNIIIYLRDNVIIRGRIKTMKEDIISVYEAYIIFKTERDCIHQDFVSVQRENILFYFFE